MRYVFFDIETTGLDVVNGDRIFEIGCVEVIDRKKTGKVFHSLLNPQKLLSEASKDICKISDEDLTNKPFFVDVFKDFLDFLKAGEDTVLVAHNAKFDINFINYELSLVSNEKIEQFKIIDSIKIARIKYPGSPSNLNSLAKRFEIDLSSRGECGHGALLDSDILADVFLKMCNGDDDDYVFSCTEKENLFFGIIKQEVSFVERDFIVDDEELDEHQKILDYIKSESW